MTISESELDNILVHQKDKIRNLIIAGDFEKAHILLLFVKELWAATYYTYKYNELLELAKQTLRSSLDDESHWKRKQVVEAMLKEWSGP